jgi:hypothetical protein
LPDLRKAGAAAVEPERIEVAAQADDNFPAPVKKAVEKKKSGDKSSARKSRKT